MANNDLEQTLWAAADKLRGHLDAAEYKHVVLGLIFLKFISDKFQFLYNDLAARADTDSTNPEDRDEYTAENVFWVPAEARGNDYKPILTSQSQGFSGDVLGRVYKYFLDQFASAEGKKGGEFHTPQSIVKLLVAMLESYKGRVYDPCCGADGMFVQLEQFVEEHQSRVGDISIYGQESNPTTWKLARDKMRVGIVA